jgi:hypothetical protein
MPFDGAEFLPQPSSGSSASVPPKQVRYRRWLTALRQKITALFVPAPLPPETAAAVARLLEEARGRIASPEAWAQFAYRTPLGQHCAVGALYRAGAEQPQPSLAVVWKAHNALLQVALRRGYPTVEMMNDRSTHEQVLTAFDIAITAARSRAAA